MINFFKNFAKGVLYVLVLPGLIAGLTVYAVVALFVFVYLAIKGLVLFFMGRSLYEDLPEDKEAKRRLGILPPEPVAQPQAPTEIKVEKQEQVLPQQESDNSSSKDSFYVPEYLKTEEQKNEVSAPKEEDNYDVVKEPKPEPEPQPEPRPEPRPIIINQEDKKAEEEPIFEQKTPQNTNIFSINDIDDIDDSNDDNTGSGIDIDFN